jgi:hypothetical protein
MHVVIVLLKAVLVLVAVPVLITIHLATAERLKDDKFWRRWIFNLPFLGLVLVSGGAVAIIGHWVGSTEEPANCHRSDHELY